MSWKDILKRDSWEKWNEDQKKLQGIGERRIESTDEYKKNTKEQLEMLRNLMSTPETDSKKPDETGKFLNKPKPKQPQSKFIDSNPNDEPSNPFKKINESD
tara:strand:+ start:932 stop:1234 length:303 start_codon:yes stop_codon:yes gene_type:complete